jgi:hypothetical protein
MPLMTVAFAPSEACTIFYPLIQVGASFRVRVDDHGRPVKKLRIKLLGSEGGNNRRVSDTDKNGIALFRNLPPGLYHVSTENDSGIPDGADVQVVHGRPADATINLKWPSKSPIVVRALKGTIHAADDPVSPPQPALSLDLLEGNSGRLLKSVQTAGDGEFAFEGYPSGLYFLSLKPSPGAAAELIAVAVDTGAATDRLDIDFGWTSCGLWYIDRHQCPQPDLPVGQASGSVVDFSGGAVPGATILLLDRSHKLVERLQPGPDGKFNAAQSSAKNYELVVSAPGFTPFHTTAHAEQPGNSERPYSLTVQLGVGGSCSRVEFR